MAPAEDFDVFLSHGTPDKPWVETLASELRALGLKPFYDLDVLEPADSFPLVLSQGLARSRFLVLILSPRSDRPWVRQEWAAFLAHHGPEGRLIPVLLESTEVPTLLAAVQRIDATDRDAARVAQEIARIAGRPGELPKGDTRRLVLGQDLVFSLEMAGDDLRVTDPTGQTHTLTPPWKVDNRFGLALHFYERLTREPVTTDTDRADLFQRATTLGSLLFGVLFDEEGRERLRQAMISGRARPLITIRSEEDDLLALPWELLCQDGYFLLRDARVDLARSTPGTVGAEALLREPDSFLKLVVNVSAPEGSGLDYEGESYRITKALSDKCHFVPTELGTVDDFVESVRAEKPTVIHFSGHGAPGALVFEDDEGRAYEVSIHDLLQKLRTRIDGALPPLFYLASCHGNDAGEEKAETSTARLHREGIPQVVGYDGPIVDELSTRAEVAFYRALAEGGTTRNAVRQAREALAAPFGDPNARHRPRAVAEPGEKVGVGGPDTGHTHPFAWAQLVLYHRGPDHPLSLPAVQGLRESEEDRRRTFTGAGDRRVLATGFIGRRSEMHQVRRRVRRGDRVFVFQGLGGLGKSTLAFHVLPMIQRGEGEILALWCQEVEQQSNRLEGLVGQLLDYCRKRFGLDWEQVVHQVDRTAGDDPLQRFALFLQVLLQNVPRLVLYLDNLESLQVSPTDSEAEGDAQAVGEWVSEDLGRLWDVLNTVAQQEEHFYIVASCRYRNPGFCSALLPVSPLPPDALFRLMSWFPALRRLSLVSRARLIERLAGHPRAVEYANDLLAHAFAVHEDHHGVWQGDDPEREWAALVETTLPKVHDKLRANLLLAEIWDRVLTNRGRRMLYRMSLLRRPWQWPLMAVLGDEEDGEELAFGTAERLRRTSLLEQVEVRWRVEDNRFAPVRHFALHPATVQLVQERYGEAEGVRKAVHRRLGNYFEKEVSRSHFLELMLEAGYHYFHAQEYSQAFAHLGSASDWLLEQGRFREGLRVLELFLGKEVRDVMARDLIGDLMGTLGLAYAGLGEAEEAIKCYEQALVIHQDVGNRQKEGTSLGNLGIVYWNMGEVEKSTRYYQDALVIAREIGDLNGQSRHLTNLGVANADLREMERAITYHKQALEIARETGYRLLEASILGHLGVVHSKLGQATIAAGYFEQQMGIAREIENRREEGSALGNLGLVHKNLGDWGKAIGYYEQYLEIVREIGDRRGEGGGLGNLGVVYACLGETNKAIALLEQALAIGIAMKDPRITRSVSATLEKLRSA